MKFDGNKAWQDAIAAVSANRSVLFPVAGVFFLIPAIVQAFFFSDLQAQVLSNFGNAEAISAAMQGHLASFFLVGLLSGVAQLIGYLAVLALLTDRTRPTVGEALLIGVKSLPTLIGASLLFVLGYVLLSIVYGAIAGAIVSLTGSTASAAVLTILLLAVMFYTMIKLSLTLPVVIIERVMNPVSALLRSWRLTKGNSFRLGLFYFLLMLAYLVIAIVVGMILMGVLTLLGGTTGKMGILLAATVSGAIGAVASVLLIGILASIHRQLAGPSATVVSETFE
ncbi:MAG: glycerophosphoryl diester phosphodiesterase membrane domain-containing protein [Novosphingobium sp.]|nr:glycerophosphoryl diester phosphodiesterase membrane domain-containing protein [Novosphingobium sp.]